MESKEKTIIDFKRVTDTEIEIEGGFETEAFLFEMKLHLS